MDKYGFYILSAYGAVALSLAFLVGREIWNYRRLKKELANYEKN